MYIVNIVVHTCAIYSKYLCVALLKVKKKKKNMGNILYTLKFLIETHGLRQEVGE